MSENVLRDTRNGESLHVRDEPRWMLFAVIDDHPIRLTYYNNKLQKGDLGIAGKSMSMSTFSPANIILE